MDGGKRRCSAYAARSDTKHHRLRQRRRRFHGSILILLLRTWERLWARKTILYHDGRTQTDTYGTDGGVVNSASWEGLLSVGRLLSVFVLISGQPPLRRTNNRTGSSAHENAQSSPWLKPEKRRLLLLSVYFHNFPKLTSLSSCLFSTFAVARSKSSCVT
jgi:hypothetical protein